MDEADSNYKYMYILTLELMEAVLTLVCLKGLACTKHSNKTKLIFHVLSHCPIVSSLFIINHLEMEHLLWKPDWWNHIHTQNCQKIWRSSLTGCPDAEILLKIHLVFYHSAWDVCWEQCTLDLKMQWSVSWPVVIFTIYWRRTRNDVQESGYWRSCTSWCGRGRLAPRRTGFVDHEERW